MPIRLFWTTEFCILSLFLCCPKISLIRKQFMEPKAYDGWKKGARILGSTNFIILCLYHISFYLLYSLVKRLCFSCSSTGYSLHSTHPVLTFRWMDHLFKDWREGPQTDVWCSRGENNKFMYKRRSKSEEWFKGKERKFEIKCVCDFLSPEKNLCFISVQKLFRSLMKSLLSFWFPRFFFESVFNQVKLIFVLKWHPIIDFHFLFILKARNTILKAKVIEYWMRLLMMLSRPLIDWRGCFLFLRGLHEILRDGKLIAFIQNLFTLTTFLPSPFAK